MDTRAQTCGTLVSSSPDPISSIRVQTLPGLLGDSLFAFR